MAVKPSRLRAVATPPEPEDVNKAIEKVLDSYENHNRELMAEVHNKIVTILSEAQLTLPYLSILLNMLLREVVDKATIAYNYSSKQE